MPVDRPLLLPLLLELLLLLLLLLRDAHLLLGHQQRSLGRVLGRPRMLRLMARVRRLLLCRTQLRAHLRLAGRCGLELRTGE